MAACPSCGRPVALTRPQCLYCGAGLPKAAVAEAARQAQATMATPAGGGPPASGPPRALVVLDMGGADAGTVATALALSLFEAGQRARRGGWQLHRIAPAEDAEREVERMTRAGIRALSLPEAEVRGAARPVPVAGGSWDADTVTLRTEAGPLRVAADGLLLVVRGPVTREYAAPARARRVRTATLDPGYRFHLHGAEPRPLELDPAAFDFGPGPAAGSSLLRLSAWVEKLAAGVPVDDGFRREPPALGPAAPETAGLAAALGQPAARRREEEALVLDNLEQFRFYSAWRGLLARRARS